MEYLLLIILLFLFSDKVIPLSKFFCSLIFIISEDLELYSLSKSNKKSLTDFSFWIASLSAFDNFSFCENNLSISKLFKGVGVCSEGKLLKLLKAVEVSKLLL